MFRVFAGKGDPGSPPHHTMARARTPMELINIDTARPYPKSLGGSWFAILFVDRASHLQRYYGTWDKSAPIIVAVVKRFVTDMGIPIAFRTDDGSKYTNRIFVEYCYGLGIHVELTAPYTPQQNGLVVEITLARAMKDGLAARLEVSNILPNVHLERVNGVSVESYDY